jgi:hypothetical protein
MHNGMLPKAYHTNVVRPAHTVTMLKSRIRGDGMDESLGRAGPRLNPASIRCPEAIGG